MQPIPTPQVLDPDRLLADGRGDLTADHQARAALLEDGLHKSCDYARQLWNTLDGVRGYLMDCLPSDPRSPGPHPQLGASPTGPDDDKGWDSWITAYASVSSVLCGPHGDSGFGLGEARHAAELRRNAPNLNLYAAHPELTGTPEPASPAAPAGSAPAGSAPVTTRSRGPARAFATVLLVLLAARGVLPRRRGYR